MKKPIAKLSLLAAVTQALAAALLVLAIAAPLAAAAGPEVRVAPAHASLTGTLQQPAGEAMLARPALTSPLMAAPASVTANATATLLSSDFEAGMSDWAVSSTPPSWGRTTYRAQAGSYSVYCAQSTIAAPGPYANNMACAMVAGPFDLSDATSASLTYGTWFDLAAADRFLVGFSSDGTNFTYAWWTGALSSNGWYHDTNDLGSFYGTSYLGKQVWVAFAFTSDASGTAEGAYVDNVLLTKQTQAPAVPTVTSFTPTSGPVGTVVTLTGTLFTGATAVTFNGTAASFSVVSNAQLTATVPAGATTGPIAVTTPGGTGTSATSFTVTAPPAVPTITLKLSGLTSGAIKLGKRVTATGTLTPTSLAGSTVTLTVQQKKGATWVKVKSAARPIGASGAYSWKYKPAKKGAYRMQATIAQTAAHAAAASKWRTFKALAAGHEGPGTSAKPGRPTAKSPHGLIVDNASPTFTWSKAKRGKGYQLRLYGDGQLALTVTVSRGTSCDLGGNQLLENVNYSWKIRAHNSAGYGPWSNTLKFEVSLPHGPQPVPTELPLVRKKNSASSSA